MSKLLVSCRLQRGKKRGRKMAAASGRDGFRAALRLKQNIAQMRSTAGDLTDIIPG